MEERKFPLIFWEQTEDFKQEKAIAIQRSGELIQRLKGRGFEC